MANELKFSGVGRDSPPALIKIEQQKQRYTGEQPRAHRIQTVFRNPKSQTIDARPGRSASAAARSSRRRRGSGGRRSKPTPHHARPCLGRTTAHKNPRGGKGTHLVPRSTRGAAGGGRAGGRATGAKSPRQRRMLGPARGGLSGSPRGAYWSARSPSPAAAWRAAGGEQGGGAQRPFDLFKKDRANFRDFLRYFPRFFA